MAANTGSVHVEYVYVLVLAEEYSHIPNYCPGRVVVGTFDSIDTLIDQIVSGAIYPRINVASSEIGGVLFDFHENAEKYLARILFGRENVESVISRGDLRNRDKLRERFEYFRENYPIFEKESTSSVFGLDDMGYSHVARIPNYSMVRHTAANNGARAGAGAGAGAGNNGNYGVGSKRRRTNRGRGGKNRMNNNNNGNNNMAYNAYNVSRR